MLNQLSHHLPPFSDLWKQSVVQQQQQQQHQIRDQPSLQQSLVWSGLAKSGAAQNWNELLQALALSSGTIKAVMFS